MHRNLVTVLFTAFATFGFGTLGFAQFSETDGQKQVQSVVPNAILQAKETVDEEQLYIVEKINIASPNKPTVTLRNVQYKTIDRGAGTAVLPKSLEVKTLVSIERKKAIAFAFVPQYIQEPNGAVKKIVSYELDVRQNNQTANKTLGNRVYAANSVLATGDWYKIAITKQGIYKIGFNFLQTNLGLNMGGVNPAQIRIFGNGGEVLPEDNNIIPNDDLVENPIDVVGAGDGKFDAGDYILFYANGPHSILPDSANKRFTHTFNPYSEVSYYYLNFGQQAGKRIALQASLGTATQTTSTANFFHFIEDDKTNPGSVGKVWWSEAYANLPGKSLSKSFTLNVPNIDASQPVNVRTRAGAIAFAGNSNFNVTVNGQTAYSLSIGSTGSEWFQDVIKTADRRTDMTLSGNSISINTIFSPSNSSATGYLDFIEVNGRRNLNFFNQLKWADWNTVGAGNIVEYQIAQANSNVQIWDISNPLEPAKMQTTLTGTNLTFKQTASDLHTFVAFDGSSFLTPSYKGKVANQNLHGKPLADYIIIAHPNYMSQAQDLAAYHAQKRGYKTLVVTPGQIYNEFSSGSQDVSAIRNFIKMFYDKASGPADMPDNVLFFGDASYDYKNRLEGNTNFVPSYQTDESIDRVEGYCTDDFFGFLDDTENPNVFGGTASISTLDVGIGRIPSDSKEEANAAVAKIKTYDSPNSFGPWKNTMVFNADDEDNNVHFDDAEIMAGYVNDSLPQYNNYKIYVDAFQQISTPAGQRTPEANRAIKEHLFNGAFVVNYNGHGGPLGWCEERILSLEDIQGLDNINKLPLFITATCDFTQFDNPNQKSAGEILFASPRGGAIALMTTTRLVFQNQNRPMNLNYFKEGFDADATGSMPTLGEAYRASKNVRYVSSIDVFTAANFRKFALIGDPGLPLAFPEYEIHTDSVRDANNNVVTDTLKALGKYTITGRVTDANKQLLTSFNGTVFPTIFDKPKSLRTLANDGGNTRDFFVQNNVLYKGKATVTDGQFSFTFVVPKDINYNIAKGKISYYANTNSTDATGFDKEIFIGGSSDNALADNEGPKIDPFLNDEKFVNGGITTANSTLLIKLFDENGINYSGTSVGHDITAVLDDDPQKTYVLNNFFEAALDSFTAGTVRFPLEDLALGKHTMRIKAWDVLNNSSEALLDFVVVDQDAGQLEHVYNYPNPFTTNTRFMFEHNMPNQNINVSLKIFSMTGKAVKQFRETINTPGTRYDGITWDGMDQYGDKLANGVYLYKLSIKSENGFSDDKIQKLIIMR